MTDRRELTWRKSSKSSGGACVEVATRDELVCIRHSKDPAGPMLTFDREAFRDFIAFVKQIDAMEE